MVSDSTTKSRFVCIEVRVTGREAAERVLAEAAEAGCSGCEEREVAGASDTVLLLYSEASGADALGKAVAAVAGPAASISAPVAVEEVDWSQAWRQGLAACEISPRLVVRPSFVEHVKLPGQQELVIDPGQAFGTGGHESTWLALELLDHARSALTRTRVLDVGAGSGVLAMAALRLGASSAVGFDLDPVALPEARANARRNQLDAQCLWYAGGLDALAPTLSFPLIVANLLLRELEPLLPELARRLEINGLLILSGVLESQREMLVEWLDAQDLRVEREAQREDSRGESWWGGVAQVCSDRGR